MRVLIAHSFYRLSGGEDRYVEAQTQLLVEHHDVELLGPRNSDLKVGARTARRMTFSQEVAAEVEERLRGFRPQVIHLHNAYPSLGPAVHTAAKRHRIPIVMTVHNLRLRCPNGYMFTEGQQCRRCEGGMYGHAVVHDCFPRRTQAVAYASALWLHRFVWNLERKIAMFVAPSQFMHDRLLEWGFPQDRIRLVRHFTTPQAPRTNTARDGFGMYSGRLSSEKGLDLLITALARAGDPPFKIVGDGPLRRSLETLAHEIGLRRTTFTGLVPHAAVQEMLADAAFLVMPTRSEENAPLAALEAIAAGLPLLVSGTGGLPELVADGAGLSFEPGNAEACAAALRRLHDDEELRRRAASAALGFFERHLRPETHLEALETVYRDVTASPTGARG